MTSKRITAATAGLTLRPIEAGDAEAVLRGIGNWNVIRWLAHPPWPYARADADGFIARSLARNEAPGDIARAIALDGALIGVIGINPRQAGPVLGFWLAEPFWGHGHMTKAASMMIDRFFETGSFPALMSGYLEGNAASARIHATLGFVETGRSRLWSTPRGEHAPHVDLALSRETWMARRAGRG